MISAQEILTLHDQYLIDPIWPDNFKLQYQNTHTILEFIEAIMTRHREDKTLRRSRPPPNSLSRCRRAADGTCESVALFQSASLHCNQSHVASCPISRTVEPKHGSLFENCCGMHS